MEEAVAPGSNNWAVAGVHTRSGVALIANDMHLDLGVPAVWYPARLRVTGNLVDVTGVTLPGTPAVAAGSNGLVAWGFTNSYGDFADARWGKCASTDYGVRREHIVVKGEDAVEVTYRDVGAGCRARRRGLRGRRRQRRMPAGGVARDPNRGHQLRRCWTSRARVASMTCWRWRRASAFPGRTWSSATSRGRIAWTLLGRVPRTAGPDRLFGALEYRDAIDHPRIADPPVGRLWTANQRVVAGELEAVLGDDEVDVGAGGYDIGARARQIRDGLLSLSHPATEADMLAIQLDSRALFLARWRNLLLALIDEDAMHDAPQRREFRTLVSEGATEASADAVGYRLVRTFRSSTLNALWRSLSTGLLGAEFRRNGGRPVRSGGLAPGERATRPRLRRPVAENGARSCCSGSMRPSKNW